MCNLKQAAATQSSSKALNFKAIWNENAYTIPQKPEGFRALRDRDSQAWGHAGTLHGHNVQYGAISALSCFLNKTGKWGNSLFGTNLDRFKPLKEISICLSYFENEARKNV